jgi:hypothetical protein
MTSLGAGGSLIAAALCAAAFVGGLLAIGDAVDGAADARDGDVTVPAARAAEEPATAEPDLPTAAAAATAAERRAPVRRDRRRAPERSLRPRGGTTAPASPIRAPSGGGDTSSTGEDAGGGSGSADPAPPPAEGRPGGPVRRTLDQAREAVAPVVDAAPEPVQPAVDEVVTVVDEVAGTVDEVVAPVTDLLPPLGGR